MDEHRKIKILFLRSVLDHYGVSKIMFQLAAVLIKKGYRVIFATDNRDCFKKQIEDRDITHYALPIRPDRKNIITFFICFFKICAIVKKEKISLIHSHHRWSSFISFFVSKLFRIPLVTTYHGINRGNKKLTIWGNKIISVSEDGKNHLIDYFKVKPDRIKVIPNGINLPSSENLKSSPDSGVNTDQPVIANISRLSPEKDQETLFLAIKEVIRNNPDLRLLMVGKGPLEDHLKKFSEKLGLTRNVEFTGEIKNISAIYSNIKFLVMSSTTEGFPMAVLEALAFSKPVVSTNVGDIPKLVINRQTGLLVPPKNWKKLAEAINLMLSNTNLAQEMGQNGRKLVQEKYSIDKMTLETEQLYHSLLSRDKV